ncbi:MAG TPA: hypothetical protein VIV06_00405 [Candidatus Limnocylindrales bacterium]
MSITRPVRPHRTGREKILPTLLDLLDWIEQVDTRMIRIEELCARPRIVEFVPDHRRLTDGGLHVKRQRRTAAARAQKHSAHLTLAGRMNGAPIP